MFFGLRSWLSWNFKSYSFFSKTFLSSIILYCVLWSCMSEVLAQSQETPLQTFGYFQVTFRHDDSTEEQDRANSSSVQQLNLIFQKTFSREWLAFINFELLNNFSSSRRWGSFDLDEAWVRYRADQRLTLKAGLHVPIFNHLNEIKNRTPLLPYVIRPLIYEESFSEFVNVEEFIPERAFFQANGSFPLQNAKLDYAAYLGNSPNINSQFDNQRTGIARQTGVDTTTTVLVGGRIGLRMDELKVGISSTRESDNFLRTFVEPPEGGASLLQGLSEENIRGVPKTRIGGDLSFRYRKFSLESEVIAVLYNIDVPTELGLLPDGSEPHIDINRLFYYGTLGYEVDERLFLYGSYWFTQETSEIQVPVQVADEDLTIKVFSVGARYSVLQDEDGFDRITMKAQYAFVPIDFQIDGDTFDFKSRQEVHFFGLAISVLF